MYNKITLYTKHGLKFHQWSVWTEGATVVVEHGQWGGKLTQKRYDAKPKNVGRSNATTAEEQAALEAEAKVTKQLKSGYSISILEAERFIPFFPMKAQNYNDFSHKVEYPCIIQPKLDGQRLMIDKNGDAWSKQGEPLELPTHWENVRELAIKYGGLDGEVYAGLKNKNGLALQQIISAFRKHNEDTSKLQYWVYDIPDKTVRQEDRYQRLMGLECEVVDSDFKDIVVNAGIYIEDEEDGDEEHADLVAEGYEGSMYRNLDGMYEFDKRSYNLIKRKPRRDAEAVVVSVTQDRNGDGVLLCQAINGKQTGVQFECLMRKDINEYINYRKYSNALLLIHKAITYEYEDIGEDTDNGRGKPQKPVGVALREMLGNEGRY